MSTNGNKLELPASIVIRDLAQKVSSSLTRQNAPQPPDFREHLGQRAIETTARESTE